MKRYEVQMEFSNGDWENVWYDDNESTQFDTREEAEAALAEFLEETHRAYEQRLLASPYPADEFRIVEVEPDEPSDGMTDAEADADVLASAGMGTDEDYGYYGGDE